MEAFLYTFSQPGACRAAMNYYRNMFKVRDKKGQLRDKVEKPILLIWVSASCDVTQKKNSNSI